MKRMADGGFSERGGKEKLDKWDGKELKLGRGRSW